MLPNSRMKLLTILHIQWKIMSHNTVVYCVGEMNGLRQCSDMDQLVVRILILAPGRNARWSIPKALCSSEWQCRGSSIMDQTTTEVYAEIFRVLR